MGGQGWKGSVGAVHLGAIRKKEGDHVVRFVVGSLWLLFSLSACSWLPMEVLVSAHMPVFQVTGPTITCTVYDCP